MAGAATQSKVSSKQEGLSRSSPTGRASDLTKLYIGWVKKNYDHLKHGRVWVWIPELSGLESDEKYWFACQYTTFFAGATPEYNIKQGSDQYKDSQQSYGWWGTPPDLDNQVLVMFALGDPNRGFVLGYLYQAFMNFMVPGLPSADADGGSSKQGADPCGKQPATVEYNKWQDVPNKDPPPPRPRYDPLHNALTSEGLYKDPQRGPSAASARRDDKNNTSNDPYGYNKDPTKKLKAPPKAYGFLSPKGATFTIEEDEGDPDGKRDPQEYMRLRTRNGNQLLLHTCTGSGDDQKITGYVYMNTALGNSWLELRDDGIYLYTSESVNIRAQKDFNLHVDGDISVHCGGKYTEYVAQNKEVTIDCNLLNKIAQNLEWKIGQDCHFNVGGQSWHQVDGGNYNLKSSAEINEQSGADFNISSGADIIEYASGNIYMQTSQGDLPSASTLQDLKGPTSRKDKTLDPSSCYPDTQTETYVKILVYHEPYDRTPPDHPSDSQTSSGCGSGAPPSSDSPAANADNPLDSSPGGDTGGGSGGGSSGGGSGIADPFDDREIVPKNHWKTSKMVMATPYLPKQSIWLPKSKQSTTTKDATNTSWAPITSSAVLPANGIDPNVENLTTYLLKYFSKPGHGGILGKGANSDAISMTLPITHVTIHCSETSPNQDIGAIEIIKALIDLQHSSIFPFHYIIRRSGKREIIQPLTLQCNHVNQHNDGNIAVCLVGGRDTSGKPSNNFTWTQSDELVKLLTELKQKFPGITNANIKGHDEWYLNAPQPMLCPNFSVKHWLSLNPV